MMDKPPFVLSQRLLLLDAGVDDPHRYLKPALFRPGGDGDAGGQSRQRPEAHEEDPWQPVSRRKLFFDGDARWLCLTTDAGVGKSTTLRWAEQETGHVWTTRRQPGSCST